VIYEFTARVTHLDRGVEPRTMPSPGRPAAGWRNACAAARLRRRTERCPIPLRSGDSVVKEPSCKSFLPTGEVTDTSTGSIGLDCHCDNISVNLNLDFSSGEWFYTSWRRLVRLHSSFQEVDSVLAVSIPVHPKPIMLW